MQIAVAHLTRIKGTRICAAGIEPATGRHIRPVLALGPPEFDLLVRNGGPFDLGRLVELGPAKPAPVPPHIEDHLMIPSQLRPRGRLAPGEFWKLLESVSRPRLREIFGPDLHPLGRGTCGTDEHKGTQSLGLLRPTGHPRIQLVPHGRSGNPEVRIRVCDGQFDLDLRVTDLRVHKDDQFTPDPLSVDKVAAAMPAGVLLGVGLTRAFAGGEHAGPPKHWLQVTAIHLAADPGWELGL
jgi:hypothetical protein